MNKETRKLLSIVDAFAEKKIAVWGDFILDVYLYGTPRRISREAPVLILSQKHREFSLGGAGNSLLNLKALGASPLPVGVLGEDEEGHQILKILKEKGIPTISMIRDKISKTPVKTRILAGEETAKKQQILRIDQEGRVPQTPLLKDKIRSCLQTAKEKVQALLISDYNYFTVQEDVYADILPDFSSSKIPVTLDSRFRILSFKGTTVSTPNEPEVEQALRISIDGENASVTQAGKTLLKKTGSKAVLITRGSRGMVLFERRRPPYPIPIHGTADIVDGTGAGDTVISVFTLALACGASFRQASHLANFAASVVVMKKGTATLSPGELKEAIIS